MKIEDRPRYRSLINHYYDLLTAMQDNGTVIRISHLCTKTNLSHYSSLEKLEFMVEHKLCEQVALEPTNRYFKTKQVERGWKITQLGIEYIRHIDEIEKITPFLVK